MREHEVRQLKLRALWWLVWKQTIEPSWIYAYMKANKMKLPHNKKDSDKTGHLCYQMIFPVRRVGYTTKLMEKWDVELLYT